MGVPVITRSPVKLGVRPPEKIPSLFLRQARAGIRRYEDTWKKKAAKRQTNGRIPNPNGQILSPNGQIFDPTDKCVSSL
jgi:hypothetical protein